MAVGLEPQPIASMELGEGASVKLGQQLFGWVNWRGSDYECFVGYLGPDDLLHHLTL